MPTDLSNGSSRAAPRKFAEDWTYRFLTSALDRRLDEGAMKPGDGAAGAKASKVDFHPDAVECLAPLPAPAPSEITARPWVYVRSPSYGADHSSEPGFWASG